MKFKLIAAAVAFSTLVFFENCRKNSDNPFDDIIRPVDSSDIDRPFDSTSITGLYRLIFREKCAIPSCHGGTFEPDFRTPQSSWSTLVWAPVIKNTDDYRFRFRVIPGDATNSWLLERCITDDPILGRMPRYADPLSPRELYWIRRWIENGACDLRGEQAARPNLNVRCYGTGAWAGSTQLDTNRVEWASPFSAPANTVIGLVPYFVDEDTPIKDLLDVRLFCSTTPDFVQKKEFSAIYVAQWDIWVFELNTNNWPSGTQVFMQYQARDTDHAEKMLFPSRLTPDYWKANLSFKIQ